MDHLDYIEQLKADLFDYDEQARTIQAKADGEQRNITEDEENEINRLLKASDDAHEEIGRREKLMAQHKRLQESFGPKSEPQMPEVQAQERPQSSKRTPRVEVTANFTEDRGKWGWRSMGEFARAVRVASAQNGVMDPRLIANAQPTTYGTEAVGEDGGFAVPPDFRTAIMEKVSGVDSLLGRTDQMTTQSNSMTFPADETTPWQSSGGILSYWVGEAGQITESKPQLKEKTVRLHKLAALVNATDELLSDASALSSYINRKVPMKFDYSIQDAIINGSGAGKPVGIMSAGCLVTAAAATDTSPIQTSGFRFRNAIDMWNRLYPEGRANSVWLAHPSVEAELHLMQFSNASSVTNPFPVYLPPGGASASPYGTLLGRPVLIMQACKALNTTGDIILADMSQYLSIVKGGGVRQDVSIHIFFDYDTTAFRFIFRVGGMPWWGSAITDANGGQTRSCFVALATRS